MKALRTLMHSMILIAATLGACATDSDTSLLEQRATISRATAAGPQIRSAQQLSEHLRTTPDSPLALLKPAARERFVASMKFTKAGLASYAVTELEALTASQVYEVLALFGLERTTPMIQNAQVLDDADAAIMAAQQGDATTLGVDHEGYECAGRGSCAKASNYICTSNCVIQ